jgi:hypothetical protein
VSVSFDEPNLVPCAGLLPAAALAQRLDVAGVVDGRLTLGRHGANSGIKAMTVIGAMLAGGDSIDDTALLRVGALPQLFDLSRAPSTIGTWLRDFRWHNVRQLDAVSRELLARQWAAGAGPVDLSAPLTIDLDSTIVATGQVVFSRLRGGAAGAARGAKSFLTETISRIRAAGATGQLTVRADSAFYSKAVLHTAAKFNVRFSITVRQDKRIRAAIEAIPESAWRPIPYWLSTPEVSGADAAETRYTAFADTKRAMDVRLIVRRVRPTPGSQLALFTTWDYHAFVTDRAGDTLELEADHRRHAIVEQSIAELKSAGLAHLPSGRFMANAAWLALAVIAHNLARAVGLVAGDQLRRATATTLRRALFTMPGRLVRSGRRRRLRLPKNWPWAEAFATALTAITAIPKRC